MCSHLPALRDRVNHGDEGEDEQLRNDPEAAPSGHRGQDEGVVDVFSMYFEFGVVFVNNASLTLKF